MAAPGIFVSYYSVDKTYPDYRFAMHLTQCLQAKGAEVLTENAAFPGNSTQKYFYTQLSRCQWYIVILSPEAMQAQRIHLEVEAALALVAQRRLQGVLSLMRTPYDPAEIPQSWSAMRIYDASEDSNRALAGIFVALNMVRFQAPPPVALPAVEAPSRAQKVQQIFSARLQAWQQRKYVRPRLYPSRRGKRGIWFAALAVPLALLLILTGVLISSNRAGSNKPAKRPTGTQTTATILPTSPAALYTYVTRLRPTVDDPLSGQDSNQWDETAGSCAFIQSAYHVSVNAQDGYTKCMERARRFSDFAYQVQMTISTGDAGGILFRSDAASTTYYRFSLDTSSQKYRLLMCDKCSSNPATLLQGGMAVRANQTYTITVIAQKNMLSLFINGQLLSQPIHDGTALSGELGVYAFEFTHATEVLFSNMKVWAL